MYNVYVYVYINIRTSSVPGSRRESPWRRLFRLPHLGIFSEKGALEVDASRALMRVRFARSESLSLCIWTSDSALADLSRVNASDASMFSVFRATFTSIASPRSYSSKPF